MEYLIGLCVLAVFGVVMIGDDDDEDGTFEGTDADDVVAGGDGDDSVHLGGGDDLFAGFGGNDTASGDSGDDLISGGAGNDLLNGGSGYDVLEGDGGNDTIRGGGHLDVILGGEGSDTLLGQLGQDFLQGGDGDDYLEGGHGRDAIFGGEGNDTLEGGMEDDVLIGGGIQVSPGTTSLDLMDDLRNGLDMRSFGNEYQGLWTDGDADVLNGGDGNDTLIGGAGDTLTGGEGEDEFVTGEWIEDDGSVTITDFNPQDDILVYRYDVSGTPPELTVSEGESADGAAQVEVRNQAGQMVMIVEDTDDVDGVFDALELRAAV